LALLSYSLILSAIIKYFDNNDEIDGMADKMENKPKRIIDMHRTFLWFNWMLLKDSSLFMIKEHIFSDLKMITSEIMKIIIGVNILAREALWKFNIIWRGSSLAADFQVSQVKIVWGIVIDSVLSALKT
jgi:hypothetical protein